MAQSAHRTVVYIVDTDASVRQSLSRLMRSADLPARVCASLEEFVARTPDSGMACALLDVSAVSDCEPGLWRRLQAIAAALPIIALSVCDDAATRRIARALGAQAFFSKPVDSQALLDSIDWVTRAESGSGRVSHASRLESHDGGEGE